MKTCPDAVKIPESALPPRGGGDPAEAVCLMAEELLEIDLDGDEFPRCGRQHGDFYFCTRSTLDQLSGPGPTMFRPGDNTQSRYAWTPGPDGVEFGTLLDGD